MQKLTSQQRKLVYAAGIGLLLIPIVILGAPSSGRGGGGAVDRGGVLAQLRRQNELGESTIGKVDPASATMNLVLLGFRGLAANQLWMQADEQKRTKQWAALETTVDQIILLQPHFKKVWLFQGWNLAYNVSTSWDAVEDRYYWVKKGGKFLMEGTRQNKHFPDVFWETGRVLGPKIGRSDEWFQFRQFFKSDPNVAEFRGGQDPDFAGDGGVLFPDNYLAAQHWWYRANDAQERYRQETMSPIIFRSYPVRAQFDYANAFHREGIFNSDSRAAWQKAYDDWTGDYARQEFVTSMGGTIALEADDKMLRIYAERDAKKGWVHPRTGKPFSIDQKRLAMDGARKTVNFNYWKNKAKSESQPLTEAAHREIFEGERLAREDPYLTLYRPVGDACADSDDLELTDDQRELLELLCQGKAEAEASSAADDPSALVSASFAIDLSDLAKRTNRSETAVSDDLFVMQELDLVVGLTRAQQMLESGMEKYERVLQDADTADLAEDTLAIEEAMLAVRYYIFLHDISGRPLPSEYPLKSYWDAESDNKSGRWQQVEGMFIRDLEKSKQQRTPVEKPE